jgi:hypothetical protein
MRIARMYVCDAGVVQVAENGSYLGLFFALTSQHRLEPGSAMHLARHPAFPDLVGLGETQEMALGRLRSAFHAFVEQFLEKSGLTRFEEILAVNGFRGAAPDDPRQDWLAGPSCRITVYSMEFRKTFERTHGLAEPR